MSDFMYFYYINYITGTQYIVSLTDVCLISHYVQNHTNNRLNQV